MLMEPDSGWYILSAGPAKAPSFPFNLQAIPHCKHYHYPHFSEEGTKAQLGHRPWLKADSLLTELQGKPGLSPEPEYSIPLGLQ